MFGVLNRRRVRLAEWYAGWAERIGESVVLSSIRRGLVLMIPVVLIGSMALVAVTFPVPGYQALMERLFGAGWRLFFQYVYDGTTGILSLNMVVCISYCLHAELDKRRRVFVSPILAVIVSLCSLLALSGLSREEFSLSGLGVLGAFNAILTAVVATQLFHWLLTLRPLRLRPFSDGDTALLGSAVTAVLPAAVTVALFAAVSRLLEAGFGVTDSNAAFSQVLTGLFVHVKTSVGRGLLFILLVHVLWFFGIHGSNLLEGVAQSVFVPALAVNQELLSQGLAPNQIFTKTFFDTFVFMGGCGASLCLVLAVFLRRRSKSQLRIARLSLVPILFNINELLIFGFPVVLSPVYLVPFVTVPLLLTLVSWLATASGLVPITIQAVEWTTPVLLSGYYATGSLRGCLLQLFNLALGTVCYLPFVHLSQDVSAARMRRIYRELCQTFQQDERIERGRGYLERADAVGSLAKSLTEELREQILEDRVTLFYQPQVHYDGQVFCAEALLRWNHPAYGYIYPPLIIALAEEAGLADRLGECILDKACRAAALLETRGLGNMAVSVNITANQLEHAEFPEMLSQTVRRHGLSPHRLRIEITEQVALGNSPRVRGALNAIRDMGIELEMDDFGMGHSSLMYLKEYNFGTIKLDGSLVREIATNASCREIISSIVFLSKSLRYHVLAEFVETEEQRTLLHELGCDRYQGYLYSRAMPFEELLDYVERNASAPEQAPVGARLYDPD